MSLSEALTHTHTEANSHEKHIVAHTYTHLHIVYTPKRYRQLQVKDLPNVEG